MKNFLCLLTLLLIVPLVASAQSLVQHPNPEIDLASRWAWAQEQAVDLDESGYWIGYSIQRPMKRSEWTGSWNSDWEDRATLQDVLDGRVLWERYGEGEKRSKGTRMSGWFNIQKGNDPSDKEIVLKDIALLFRYRARTQEVIDIRVSNTDLYVDLDRRSLIWLGDATYAPSLGVLAPIYETTDSREVRKDMTRAIGMHTGLEETMDLLTDIAMSEEPRAIRKQAVYWLGRQNSNAVLGTLEAVLDEDPSEEVRKQAVYALGLIDTPEADELLIDVARNATETSIQKQGIYWLGQKASRRAIATLQDVVDDDEAATEVKKQAVYALSQLPEDEGIPLLMDIAQNHTNPKVRKQAIYWLGESGDERALDLLVELVRRQ